MSALVVVVVVVVVETAVHVTKNDTHRYDKGCPSGWPFLYFTSVCFALEN